MSKKYIFYAGFFILLTLGFYFTLSSKIPGFGKSGVTRGWQPTLENYKKGYPDTAAMGKLSFDIITVKNLSPEYFYVVGKWMLKRSIGDLSGHYNLLLRKIKGRWVIVADHSS